MPKPFISFAALALFISEHKTQAVGLSKSYLSETASVLYCLNQVYRCVHTSTNFVCRSFAQEIRQLTLIDSLIIAGLWTSLKGLSVSVQRRKE